MSKASLISGLISWPMVGALPQDKKQANAPAAQNAPAETAVRTPLVYKFSSVGGVDSAVVDIHNVEVKNILVKNFSNNNDKTDCSDKLLDMSWTMLARAIAKDAYGQDIDSTKAVSLSSILSRDNLAKDPTNSTPAEILKNLPMTFVRKLIAGLHLQFHWDQYYSYLQFKKAPDGFFQFGAFPDRLPVKLSGDFKREMAQPVVQQAASKPAKAKPQRAVKKQEQQEEPTGECGPGTVINPTTGECTKIEE